MLDSEDGHLLRETSQTLLFIPKIPNNSSIRPFAKHANKNINLTPTNFFDSEDGHLSWPTPETLLCIPKYRMIRVFVDLIRIAHQ